MVALGVDPGKNTGFAVWDCSKGELVELESYDFWSAYHEGIGWWSRARMEERKMIIRVEDPSGNSPVWHGNGKSKAVQAKIAQRVGRNKQMADLLIRGWRRAGILVQPIVPKQSKWDAKTFKNITGYQGRTNEHKRDAARMVFGMPCMPDAQYEIITERQKVEEL